VREGECGDEEFEDWLKPAAVARSSQSIYLASIALLFSRRSISRNRQCLYIGNVLQL
jgi:hypothetical protein